MYKCLDVYAQTLDSILYVCCSADNDSALPKLLSQLFKMSPLHVVSLLTLLSCAAAWEHVIYVDPLEGNNTQECIDGSVPCRNLSFAFEPEYRRSSTQYVLLPGTHYLDNSTYGSPFTDLDGLAIVGNGSNSSDTVIECIAPNSGLAFVGVSNVYLERITFNTCAGLRNSTSRDFGSENFAMQKSQAALYFYLCNNVSMSMVDVTNSPDATGVVMYDTIGTNRIEQCTFSNNRVEPTSPYPGGGGFYVEFSYCVPGDDNCTNDGSDITANQNAFYLFSNCTFVHNKADSIEPTNVSAFILPLGRDHIAFGRGGGLSIFFNGNASSNRVNIFNCSFDNNCALWGGGLFVEFHDTAGDNLVSVGGTTGFIGNKCFSTRKSGTGGGGMRIGHYVYGKSVGMNNVTLHGCQFLANSALNGGGLSISPTLQETRLDKVAFISISDCCFQYNNARLGAAIEVTKFSLIIKGHMLHAQFTNCVVRYNHIHYLSNTTLPYQTGVGSVYINEVHVSFRGDVLFERNTGSAVAVVGMPVDFMNCSANFTHNHGSKGGGIALLGSAWILINESTELYFYNNTAETHGGAIYNRYTDKGSLASHANCFIRHYNPILQPDHWNATFLFRDNYQMNDVKKNAIFSTSMLPCTRSGGSTWSNSSETLCWQGWDYNCSEEISSEPGSITFKKKPTLKAYPGRHFLLPLIIEDDVHHNITTQTVFSASSNDTCTAKVEPSFTYVSGEIVVVTGIENRTFILELDSDGDRVWHVEFTVELQNCPPGFKATTSNSEAKCECLHNGGFLGNVDCDMDSFNASLYNGYWMGVLPKCNNTLVVSICPPNFCYHNPNRKLPSFPLPDSIDKLDAHICGKQNRTGILCGECKDRHGPAVNSEIYKCIPCGNNTSIAANATYYVLSVYLPLFTLFAAIILFNIKLTTGPANAFIVYSQVVSSTFDLSADGQITFNTITNDSRTLQMVYKVPYGIFNLEFIENIISPLCLGTTLNTPDVISLDYLVAVFPLLMIVLVIFFMKLSSCIRSRLRRSTLCQSSRGISHLCGNWRLGEGLLHAFAAFLLLSYNKFSLVSSNLIQLVSPQTFYDENGTEITQDISFTGTPAIVFKYNLVGYIVFATFVAIPPLLLLEYPVKLLEWCINKVKCLQRFYPADKVHILRDTFQGCYRNKMRFFAGLYFLFRLIIDVSFVTANSWFKQSIVQQITCIVFVVLIALCQPYTKEKKVFNYIDTLMFANLALLNALSLYLYIFFQTYSGKPLPIPVFVIQYILLFLPLLYMIAYILYYLSSPCHNWINYRIRELRIMCIRLYCNRKYHPLSEVIRDDASTADETQNEDEIEALFERAKMDNTYQPNPNLTVPVAEVRMHGTGQRVKENSSSDSGVRSHQSSINNYGSTASRTVSIHTPLFSSGQATGSSEPKTDD